jgi:hypothetical protein
MSNRIALCSAVKPQEALPPVKSAQSDEARGKRSAPIVEATTTATERAARRRRQSQRVRRKVERAPRNRFGCTEIVIVFIKALLP